MQAHDLLQSAIVAIQKGDKSRAVRLLGKLLEQQPRNAEAWYWLSKTQEDLTRKRECLVRALRFQPDHVRARAEFEALEGRRIASQSSTQPARVLPSAALPEARPLSERATPSPVPSIARPKPVARQAARPRQRPSAQTWVWLSLMGLLFISVLCLSVLLLTSSVWQPVWDQWMGEGGFPMLSLGRSTRLPTGLSVGYWMFDIQRPLPIGIIVGDLVLLPDGIFWFGYLRGHYRLEDEQTLVLCVEPQEKGAASTCFRARVAQVQDDRVILDLQLRTIQGEQWVEGLVYRKVLGDTRRADFAAELVGRWQSFPLDHHTRIAQQRNGESSPDEVYLFTAGGELWAGGRRISSYRIEDGMVRVPDYFGDFGERFRVDRLGDWMALVGQINKPAIILSLKRVP